MTNTKLKPTAKELIKCPKCQSVEVGLYVHQFSVRNCMINPKTLEFEWFGEGGYEDFEGLFCTCYRCKHEWKSRKYKNIEDLEGSSSDERD